MVPSPKPAGAWKCSKCGCSRNLQHWTWCKHCYAPWQGVGTWSPDSAAQGTKWHDGNTVDNLFGAGVPDSPFKTDGQAAELGEQDLVQLVAIYTKAGQLEECNKYQSQLDQLRAQLYPVAVGPKGKLDKAHKQINHLERLLNQQTEAYDKVASQMSYHVGQIQKLSDELAEQERIYKEATEELHAGVSGPPQPPTPPAPPAVSLDEIMAGKVEFLDINPGELFGLKDYVDLTPEEKAEAEKRLNDLKQIFADQAKTMFGAVKERAEALKREHDAQKERLKKKRKQEPAAVGEEAAEAPGGGGAAPSGGAPAPQTQPQAAQADTATPASATPTATSARSRAAEILQAPGVPPPKHPFDKGKGKGKDGKGLAAPPTRG